MISANDAEMPDALLARVDLTLANGGAVAEDLVLLLDGLALQHRGTETGRRLTDAAIRARASAGAFAEAFRLLDEAGAAAVVTPDRAAVLVDDVFAQLARKASDPDFLVETIARLDAVSALPGETRRLIAARLFDLGLAAPAQIVLEGDGTLPAEEDRRLFARAALMQRRPDVAIGYLAGLATAPDLRLRAQALEMATDHAGAVEAFAEAGDREAELQAAWRGGLWSVVRDLDDGAAGRAAELMLAGPEADGTAGPAPTAAAAGDPLQPLAAAQSLVDASKATRDVLGALFDHLPAPETGAAPVPES